MSEYSKKSIKMLCNGMYCSIANDLVPEGKFQFLQNIRIFTEGILESRPMIDRFLEFNWDVAPPNPTVAPHSIKAINQGLDGGFLYFAGIGTELYIGTVGMDFSVGGFSGKPLSMVDFRPEQSVNPYLYIADENKFIKVDTTGQLRDVGIVPPRKAVVWKIGAPNKKIIDKIDTGSGAQWNTVTGSAGAPSDEIRVNTTITKYLADAAVPNFASIVPASMTADIQADSIVTLNGADDVIITEIFPAAINAGVATIADIDYDVGSSGLATIVLSVSSPDILRNSILLLGGVEYVRVLDVTRDSNGVPSIRVSTTATFAIGNTISGVASFRFYDAVGGYIAGQTIVSRSIKSAIGATGTSSFKRVFNVDLLNSGVGGKTFTNEDLFHASIKISDPTKLTSLQIILDLGNDNYYLYEVSPNFFSGTAAQTTPIVPTIQQVIQRQQLIGQARQARLHRFQRNLELVDTPDPFISDTELAGEIGLGPSVISPIETTLGTSQWTELLIRLGDFIRVGSDNSKTKKDIIAIKISVVTTAALDVFLDSLWVGGADGLETNVVQGFLPYNYVWRIRNPATKDVSNWSPPLREGIKLSRGKVELSFPDAQAIYPPSHEIDIARFGGSLNDYRLVGTVENDGSSFTDNSSDRVVADNQLAGRYSGHGATDAVFDFHKPFAILDTPKSGIANITGTKFERVSGDNLSTTYPRGTLILINGKVNKFYSNPSSTDEVELERDMGNLDAAVFELQDPLLTGQPLPIVIGTFGEGNLGLFLFGLGDENNAGTLYWLDGNSPDTMSDLNRLEITSPSEPLITGVMYDGNVQIYTNERSFTVYPTIDANGSFGFLARTNANSRGVFSRWAISSGKKYIYFLSENADGIYRVEGVGNPQRISDSIKNLFYSNGKKPAAEQTFINGTFIPEIDFTKKEEIRLFDTGDYIFFRYASTKGGGSNEVLVFDQRIDEWISYDQYPLKKINAFYQAERGGQSILLAGISNGVGKFEETADSAYDAASESMIIPFSHDMGDSRIRKLFAEEVISIDQGTEGFSIRNYYNNGGLADATIVKAGDVGHKRNEYIIEINEGQGLEAQNITTVFSWLVKSLVKVYEEIIYFIPQADKITDRAGDIYSSEDGRLRKWTGIVIRANTFDENKEINFYDDNNVLRTSVILDHNIRETMEYKFPTPFISRTIKRGSDDDKEWVSYVEKYEFDPKAVIPEVWEDEIGETDGDGSLKLWRGFTIAADTQGVDKEIIFKNDLGDVVHTEVINHDGYEVKAYDFTVPFVSRVVTRSSTDGVIWIPSWVKYEIDPQITIPEVWQDLHGYVDNLGNNLSKFWQGLTLELNTFGQEKSLQFYDENNVLRHTELITTEGREVVAIPFDNPFISHTIRMSSLDSKVWGFYTKQYIADSEPEEADVWEGEFNTNGLTGFITASRAAIAYRSTEDFTLTLTFDDGSTQEYNFVSSNGAWTKVFFYLQSKKWKACKYRFDGKVRPYRNSCEVWMKSFTSNQPFQRMTPFGGDSNITDIQI